jgi:hypothetical protein
VGDAAAGDFAPWPDAHGAFAHVVALVITARATLARAARRVMTQVAAIVVAQGGAVVRVMALEAAPILTDGAAALGGVAARQITSVPRAAEDALPATVAVAVLVVAAAIAAAGAHEDGHPQHEREEGEGTSQGVPGTTRAAPESGTKGEVHRRVGTLAWTGHHRHPVPPSIVSE